MDTYEFLNAIFGEKDFEIRLIEEGADLYRPKCCYSIVKHDNKLYTGKEKWEMDTYTDNNLAMAVCAYPHNYFYHSSHYGVFFVPNAIDFNSMSTCTSSDKDIVGFTCQFVDIDIKDEEIKKDPKKLERWKKEKFRQLTNHKAEPSIIVITKNGLHCYWLLDNGKKEMFRHIQLQLIKEFDGDPSCINQSHCLRLPGFFHNKNRKKPYPVLVGFKGNKRYTQEELTQLLPKLTEKDIAKNIKAQRESRPIILEQGEKNRLLELVKSKLDYRSISSKKIITCCPMPEHDDKNPSAWFDREFLWLHCSGCGTQLPLEDLADELGWDDVLEELNKTKIEQEVKEEFAKISHLAVNVEDIKEFKLNTGEEEIKKSIAGKVFHTFNQRGQIINEKHKKYIEDITTILLKGKPSKKPDLIPLDMGGGKSTIIQHFVEEHLTNYPDKGMVIVKERVDDAIAFANWLNNRLGRTVAYPLYGFKARECLAGRIKCSFVRKVAKNGRVQKFNNCQYKQECRYFNQNEEQKKYPVIVITHERLFYCNKSGRLSKDFGLFKGDAGQVLRREKLIIDEKPKLVYQSTLTSDRFLLWTKEIMEALAEKNQSLADEFKEAVHLTQPLFKIQEGDKRQSILPMNPFFMFSPDFWVEFECLYDYNNPQFKVPEILENIIRYGGHKEINKEKVIVSTSFYCKYTYGDSLHTVIFDGTADIDLSYKHEKYRMFAFEPLRTYENFEIFQCNYLKSTKSSLKNENILQAFCEEVKVIADNNPQSKIYLPVFSDHEDEIKDYLEDYIKQGKIKVDHYGGTKGKNDYLSCDITVIEGILHKTENYYISLHRAKTGRYEENLECSTLQKVRRFNSKHIEILKLADMVCDYTQEIKRSNQRDNSSNVHGKLFIFTDDRELLSLIPYKFPGCQIKEWNPMELIKVKVETNEHKQAKNQFIMFKFWMEAEAPRIPFEDIVKATGLPKDKVSKWNRDTIINALYTAKGYKKIRQWKNVYFEKAI